MSRVFVFVLVSVAAALGREETPQPQIYNNNGVATVCVEVKPNPHMEATKICGPMVSTDAQRGPAPVPPMGRASGYEKMYPMRMMGMNPMQRSDGPPCPEHPRQRMIQLPNGAFVMTPSEHPEGRTFPFAPLGLEPEMRSRPDCIEEPRMAGIPVRGIPPMVFPRPPLPPNSFMPRLRSYEPSIEQLMKDCEDKENQLQAKAEEIAALKTQVDVLTKEMTQATVSTEEPERSATAKPAKTIKPENAPAAKKRT